MLFKTYLLRSGSRQGGHMGLELAPHGQGHVFLQEPQTGTEEDVNPSFFVGSTQRPETYPRVNKRTAIIATENTFTRIVAPLYTKNGFMLSILANPSEDIHTIQAKQCCNSTGVGYIPFGHFHAKNNRDQQMRRMLSNQSRLD